MDPYRRFAAELGVLFQIVDDILDVTGSDEELGKPQGSDERHGKVTYVSLFGLERARELAAESHANARAALGRGRRRDRRPGADHGLHPHPPGLSAPGNVRGCENPRIPSMDGATATTTTRPACSTRSTARADLSELSDEELHAGRRRRSAS